MTYRVLLYSSPQIDSALSHVVPIVPLGVLPVQLYPVALISAYPAAQAASFLQRMPQNIHPAVCNTWHSDYLPAELPQPAI